MAETEQLFEQVYRAYGPSLYRFCLIQMKNPADAEDILQEVFCKRLYRAPVFTSPDHERRWLFRVALNHYYEGYTLREIARLLGVTVPTVKMRLKRGRDALRNTWEESL